MTKAVKLVLAVLVLGLFCTPAIFAQTTEISYQGSLKDGGSPASGNYDIEFRLFDALTGGTQIGTLVYLSPVAVADGTFSVKLDFGPNGFPGSDRYLQIAMRKNGVGSLVTLGPRQKISSAPYAVRSLQSASATSAITSQNSMALGGVNASGYVLSSDTRLTDARTPAAGSGNYVQNTSSPQAASNFNISGTGKAGLFNASTAYNFGGTHLISATGIDNIFAGAGSGLLNTGLNNAFFGANAGLQNKGGSFNAFFGAYAGENNVTGENNSFFGYFAGNGTTSGNDNSFFGNRAGQVNTSGAFNSFFGTFSGFFNNTGSDNSYFGNETGYNNTNGNRNSFLGSKAGRENKTGSDNAFLGSFAGRANTFGSNNSYVGSNAGQANQAGINNSFVGSGSGFANTASNNSFFGTDSGKGNTTGANNTFLGRNAGLTNTSGELNVFIGVNAGQGNTLGKSNTIIGAEANVVGTNLQYATAIGAEAIVNASNTVVLGRGTDQVRVPGALSVTGNMNVTGTLSAGTISFQASNLTGVVGAANGGTGITSSGMAGRFLRSNGTGWESAAFLVSDLPAGSSFYIQNGTTQQGSTNFNISGNGTAGGTLSGNTVNSISQYNISGERVFITPGIANLFVGKTAGNGNTTGTANSFVGNAAGFGNTSGGSNSFFGAGAGLNSSTGSNNTFAGSSSGSANTSGTGNSFFGNNAGQTNTTGGNNTILGSNANVGASNLSYATAIGADAVVSTSNTVVIGRNGDLVRAPGNLQVDGTLTANMFSIPASNLTGTVPVIRGGTGMGTSGTSGNYLRSNGSIWESSAIAAADLPGGNANYIQNGVGIQASSNFNISGAGTVGGSFSANLINSTTQYNIGNARVLAITGTANTFVGVGTATTGNDNSFFGSGAGASNTTGSSNTIIGSGANVGAGNLTFATALGAGATVSNNNSVVLGRAVDTVRIPGGVVVSGSFSAPSLMVATTNITGILGAVSGGTGISVPGSPGNFLRSTGSGWQSQGLTSSDIPSGSTNYIQNGGTPQSGASFNIGGSGTIAGNLTVGGVINGSFSVPASSITGILGPMGGGTGLNGPGLSGYFLRSNGTSWTSVPLLAADIPNLGTSYIQNGIGLQNSASFNIGGSGTIAGNLSVGGTITGTISVPASNITGMLGTANGGTGLNNVGSSGHFLRSNGTNWTTTSLIASDIPSLAASYIQNGAGLQSDASFNVAGSGAVGTNLTVGGNLSVTGTITGSFSVAATNLTGTVPTASGGTGISIPGLAGNFLRSNGSNWESLPLTASDIPSLGGTYIQNSISPQSASNFNISGSGTVGGTMSAGTVNSTGQYQINGVRVFANNANDSIFAGEGTGISGSLNSFFGKGAGSSVSTGSSNTMIGANANAASGVLTNATAIGANASVSQSNSVVIGAINGVNGGSSTNVGIGTSAPKAKLEVAGGNILMGSPGQGIVLRSPDGTKCTLLSIDDAGAPVWTVLPSCP